MDTLWRKTEMIRKSVTRKEGSTQTAPNRFFVLSRNTHRINRHCFLDCKEGAHYVCSGDCCTPSD